MSSAAVQGSSGGIGLSGVLFVVFLVLKLTHYIDWSWWWVTCPLWIGPAIVAGVLLVAGVVWLSSKAAMKVLR